MRVWLALVLTLVPIVARAQQVSFVVRQGGAEIGREKLTLRPGTERSADGSSLEVDAQYGGLGSSVLLQRSVDGALVLFRLRTVGAAPTTILAATSGGRLAIRRETGGAESARELPARPGTLVLDEQTWSLLQAAADAATPRGMPLTLVFPRTDRTLRSIATRVGNTVTLTGDLIGSLQVDGSGLLVRIDLPAQNLTLTRAAN